MSSFSDESSWTIFPLTDGLSSSYVDPNNLITTHASNNQFPVGMSNFRSKNRNGSMYIKRSNEINNGKENSRTRVISRWKMAVLKAKMLHDPWVEFHIEKYSAERVVRHRYNAIKKKWIQDECIVKMEDRRFANGAMRACYRLKKLSNFTHKTSWEHASNYVVKCYMDSDIPRERYFDDVKLQMDAKLWAECFNRHNPPKKVDIFQVSIVEFIDRENSPLYHLEHFIEGNYIKYNSNSGYVDEQLRSTPQAFSHFTFECSNHECIVVDIQGVGDLYTDPQIHTSKGTEYGDGNLGTRGMALFFHSHVCNDICVHLGLTPFDLAETESKELETTKSSMSLNRRGTLCRGLELEIGSPASSGEYFRNRNKYKSQFSFGSDGLSQVEESEGYQSSRSSSPSESLSPQSSLSNKNLTTAISISQNGRKPRTRNESSCLDSAFTSDDAASYFQSDARFKPRPSCVLIERGTIFERENFDSILGKIHLELCKYHETGRFVEGEAEFDSNAAFFHLQQAANLGVLDALLNISKIYLDLPHDILASYKLPESEESLNIAFDYISQAAERNDKNSILYMAKAYDTGVGLRKNLDLNWTEAIDYYNKAIHDLEDEDSDQSEDMGYVAEATDEPVYIILARMAEMYATGGHGVEQNQPEAYDLYNEAAEKATELGKGRLANKYYMLAESVAV